MRPAELSAEARARVVAVGREGRDERASWGERMLAGFMGMSVAAGVFVAVGVAGELWGTGRAAEGAGGVVAVQRGEEREWREAFERRLARGDWRMEEHYGDH